MTDRELKLYPTPTAPREARRFVRHHAADLGFALLVDDAEVIISELLTNAVTAAPNCPLWVSLRALCGMLLLEVQDCSPEFPKVEPADSIAESGRGLHVISALAIKVDWYP